MQFQHAKQLASLSLALMMSACIIQVPEGVLSPSSSPKASSTPLVSPSLKPIASVAPATPQPTAFSTPEPIKTVEPSPTPVPKKVYTLAKKEMVLWGGSSVGEVAISSENTPVYRVKGGGSVDFELTWQEGDVVLNAYEMRETGIASQKGQMRWTTPPQEISEDQIIPFSASIKVLSNDRLPGDFGPNISVGWNIDGTSTHWLIPDSRTGSTVTPLSMNWDLPVETFKEALVTDPIHPSGDHFTLFVNAQGVLGLLVRYQYTQKK
ncbi:hypothetical protein COW36_13105 [bacterium (Candidatus Blackallbacteria) CG17_big_fil_post_rev_8_21_14_2_50_48_46]|uniref:Lipoprotein n=1 Tax=bacterium (Candidatus Blackallbacteria) CG17_big_fil_post_rev_8_21_14_2_50_48_46 TaxID=2014261 RepID=A0A2M7G487_9BACT|nr:MAG: hypothetical protein COW64_02160 [bacterium (Candidatus Blackallbacteria) CG18_big_fil_WC_8_21_14_2_50_49_26]PIW16698.1 MAG: hypothetical protein COW36_13105 [bacterium (Candidatus Blackallbacteria) CG17_big_fil_post_rev_8_21_14_2_50_48_46]PIW46204.1 MAG: hypothetical protein COW20_18360 [bacterium (Candidatus Blackallbacteria) CG13_big_fil_rev_8_21_14_2_50_49_14]